MYKEQFRSIPSASRVERFLPELFVFVSLPEVLAYNNLRSVRSLVVARKISRRRRHQGLSDPHGLGLALRQLDGPTPQSFPPLSGPADFAIQMLHSHLSPRGVTRQAELTSTTYEPRMV